MSELSPFAAHRTPDLFVGHEHERRIREALDAALAPATRRAYAGALRHLSAWCAREGFADPMEPVVLAAYLTSRVEEGRGLSTITIALAAVKQAALENSVPDPYASAALRRTVIGIRRQLAGRSVRKAHALTTPELARILDTIDRATNAGKRDAAMLCLLYAAALRRSELTHLRRSDVKIGSDGMVVTIRTSKTDKFGASEAVGVLRGAHQATDPVGALARWVSTRGPMSSETPLFCAISRSGRILGGAGIAPSSLNNILQARAAAAGLELPDLSAHSGRAGHITTAALAGLPTEQIARTSRHKNLAVLAGYIRPATVLSDTSSGSLGL
ncbi:tyrosine-type recombinase/integrase [Lacisediminihabitans sp. FW035]